MTERRIKRMSKEHVMPPVVAAEVVKGDQFSIKTGLLEVMLRYNFSDNDVLMQVETRDGLCIRFYTGDMFEIRHDGTSRRVITGCRQAYR